MPPILLRTDKATLRNKLLAYFFTNPDAWLHLRDIARRLEVSAGNLSKELQALEKDNLFKSEKRGVQKFFSINKDHPLYQDLKSLIFKTIGIKGALQDLLKEFTAVKRGFIYGSFAKGEEKAYSDIDLCLIVDNEKFDDSKFTEKLQTLEKQFSREISYIYHTEEEWGGKQRQKDSFVMNVLKQKRIELKT